MMTLKTVVITKLLGKQNATLPVGYAVEGPEENPPEIGKQYSLSGYIRDSNNDRFEWFQTTEVTSINHMSDGKIRIETKNSVWEITYLNDNGKANQ